ncbi:MAG TPA: carboxy terminal-processing peptidase, partial [Kofleriaceae bacterium]|nr:carboxy terminal-processing peptidase [Kofleriaceae bacterium]
LLRKHIDDEVSKAAFTTYMDRLDGAKMFLLKSDRDALQPYADKIDDELRSGNLDLAHEGSKVFTSRVAVVEKEVAEILAQPMNHDDEEFVELDPKKLEPSTSEQDLKDRWRRRLELEVLERAAGMQARLEPKKDKQKTPKDKDHPNAVDDDDDKSALPLDKIPPTFEGQEAKARTDLAKMYAAKFARLRQPDSLDAAAELVNAVASTLDPHTTYLPPADKANFDIHMSGSLEGIGAVLGEKDEYIEVREIVPGGAAWRQGALAAGDLIVAVAADGKDPVDTADMRLDDVVKMIRGPKGTIVHLRVQKPTGSQEEIAITRDVVVVEDSYARGATITRGQATYGYIHLPNFYGGKGNPHTASGDIHKLLVELGHKKVSGIILDIRSNGGGLLNEAVELTGEFIDQGPVVQVQDSRDHKDILADDQRGRDFDGPVIVLVDQFSASASEILAGALQDYHRAIIVGTSATHGKGTVQTLADLDRATGGQLDLGVLKLTIQQFFRVSGASTQRQGVVPDILLPNPTGYIDSGERTLDHAIAWSQIAPAQHSNWTGTYKLDVLAHNSAARVAKQPVFTKVATLTALLKARQADTKISLARPAFEARRKEQKAALDAVAPDQKTEPAKLAVKVIGEQAATIAPRPGSTGKTDDRLAKWSDSLARDAWVEECVNILADIK